MIPVIAPIASDGEEGHTYNINADTMAGALAAALGAARLLLLTDVDRSAGQAWKSADRSEPFRHLPACAKTVRSRGGMIPKLETCVQAVEAGCEAAVVLDGRVPHAMLLEFFTARGAGTLVA